MEYLDIDEIEDENVFSKDEELSLKEIIEKTNEKMDRYYAELTKNVLDYILKIREIDPMEPLVQIITHYCFENNLEPELVGDAISQDYYFKQYVENDCKAFPEYRIEQTNEIQLEDW